MTVVLFFLVYLPYSKHLHLLAAPFNVFFSQSATRPVGDLGVIGAKEDLTAGASRWQELTWKQLLSGFSCAECGRCDRSCPAAASGYPLQPQQIIQKIKTHMVQAGLQGRERQRRAQAYRRRHHREGNLGLHHLPGLHELLRGVERAGAA